MFKRTLSKVLPAERAGYKYWTKLTSCPELNGFKALCPSVKEALRKLYLSAIVRPAGINEGKN